MDHDLESSNAMTSNLVGNINITVGITHNQFK